MAALKLPYEEYIKINGGEFCAICGRKPHPGYKLDRDHDHKTGKPRGLLCGGLRGCNRKLGRIDDLEWLRAALAYVKRATTL